MYSGNDEPTVILDTFAARELQQSGYNTTTDNIKDYIQRTNCSIDTLQRYNKQKEHPKLFIV